MLFFKIFSFILAGISPIKSAYKCCTQYSLLLLCVSCWFFTLWACFFFAVSGSLMSKYSHSDAAHNPGVVWGRILDIHHALLQQEEVTISVLYENTQIPIPTPGNTCIYSTVPMHCLLLGSSSPPPPLQQWSKQLSPLSLQPTGKTAANRIICS